jgi:hypothetical protein
VFAYLNKNVGCKRRKREIAQAVSQEVRLHPPRYHRTHIDTQKRMNGFKDNVWKELDKIESIELVLEDFGAMQVMNRFKGLKSLTLINCGIGAIDVLYGSHRV